MDMKKTLGAIVAGFVLQMGTNYLIHSVILMKAYEATSPLWRAPEDMGHRMWAMIVAVLVYVVGAVLIYQRGVEKKSWVGQGIRFGILLAMVAVVPAAIIEWVTVPLIHQIALHWILLEGAQAILLALLIAVICQPRTNAA